MPRFLDAIRATARIGKPKFIARHLEEEWHQHTARVFTLLCDPTIPVLLLDNVADYYFVGTDQEEWNLKNDFPNVAPPYPMFWAEWRIPKEIHSKSRGDTSLSRLVQHGRIGVLVTALDPKTDQLKGEGLPDARWFLWCELFIDYGKRDHAAEGSHGAIFAAVDEHGAFLDPPWMQTYCANEDKEIAKLLMGWLHPLFLGVSFLHCKGVEVVDNPVPPKLAKRYQERHGIRPTAYKTLVIEPLKQILRTEGRSGEVGLVRAMHICRGHFRDYREGRGLFGKYKQLVWQPSIVRGTKGKKAPPRELEVRI